MENIITSVSLPGELGKQLKQAAQESGETKSALIARALRDYLARQELLKIECKLQAQARVLGLKSEDDVVEMIHELRRHPPS